jgi:PAS domain S-box-containing protein
MTDKTESDENLSNSIILRHSDEDQLGESLDATQELEDKTTKEIIHGLRVNQIELKIRNEELQMRNEELKIALEVSRDNYQDLYDFMPVGYFTMTPKGLIKEVNVSVAKLLGMTRQKLIEKGFGQFVDPESLDQWDNHIITVLGNKDKQSCDITLNSADGSTFYTHMESVQTAGADEMQASNGETHAIRMSVTDITERKRSEEQIKLNESRLQSLHEMSQYRAKNVQELLKFTLEHAIRLTGSKVGYMYHYDVTNQRFILNTWTKDFMDQSDVANPRDVYDLEETGLWGEAVQQKKPVIVNDFQASNPLESGYPPGYGHVEFFRILTVPVFQDDKVVAVVVVTNKESDYDDSDIRQLSLLMDSVWRMIGGMRAQEREQLLVAAVEHAAEGVIVTDATGIIEYVNSAEETITCYSSDELIGQKTSIFKSGKHDDDFYRKLWETINAGKVWSGRFINKKKDGTEYHEDATISPVYDKSGNLTNFVAVKHDVTKQIELQEQLFQAQKMEAVGTLAGGIAHDFNNLLQVVLGYSEVMLLRKKEGESDYVDLKKIYQAGKRGADLVKSLLTFSRKVEAQYVPIDLNSEIATVRDLLFNTIPKIIKIDLHLSQNLASIQADPSQIAQILMNLGVNARDAMPDGGTLTIETGNMQLNEEYCASHPEAKPGNYVLLTVSDTGVGMNKEIQSHIFEPFFTTKEQGKGTGLGLATVYGIVKNHGGHINCHSEPGHGTTFNIYLPIIHTEIHLETPLRETTIPGGMETILLVEDDGMIRELCAELLNSFGYRVISAGNGKEALEIFQKDKDRISLILLDLIMPVMDGWQCLAKILRIDPNAKVIIASGYLESGIAKGMQAKGAMGFVQKPFDMRQLLTTIRKALDNDLPRPVDDQDGR